MGNSAVRYTGDGSVLEDSFVLDGPLSPEKYLELTTGEKNVPISSLNDFRLKLDQAGFASVLDYPLSDVNLAVDEAVTSDKYLTLVEYNSGDAREVRIFQIANERLDQFKLFSERQRQSLDETIAHCAAQVNEKANGVREAKRER